MSFLLISDTDRRSPTLGAPDRALFRADALEIRMYYVPEGETILVTRRQDALLMEGGSGRALRNPARRLKLGKGVPIDLEQAKVYHEKACELGYERACDELKEV